MSDKNDDIEAVLTSPSADYGSTTDEPSSFKPSKWDKLFNFDSSNKHDKILALKIDFFILTYICVSYFIKNLSQMNIRNAYVSGLKEDLNFQGNQYNYLQTWWLVGYILGVIPAQVALCKVRASILLPLLEIAWSVVTIGICKVESVHTLYGLRFLVGFFEAAAYPAFITLLRNWYTTSLGFKVTLIQISSSGAQMFLGYLQAALFANMNHKAGLAAWRWLFVFDGIIGIPVAIYGFLAVPDTPDDSRAFWLNPQEKAKCVERMKSVKRASYKNLNLETIKNIVFLWPLYLFTAVVVFHEISINLSTFLNLWLKSIPRYSHNVRLLNIIPTASYALQIVVMIIFSISSDLTGKRLPFTLGYAFFGFLGSLILLICEKLTVKNTKAEFAGWFILSAEMGFVTLVLTWLNEVISESAEQRTIVIGVTQAVGFAFQAWVALLIYPASEAPHYKNGYQCAMAFFAVEAFLCVCIWYVLKLDKKGKLKHLQIKTQCDN